MTEQHCVPGTILSDHQVQEKRKVLIPAVVEKGWTLLWKCTKCGCYWESEFKGRYDEIENLRCLAPDEIKQRWEQKLKNN
jgi:hypothetical protein